MRAIGFPTFRYKLVCFVIAGALCGLAGALLANHTNFISPALMHWTRSGDLIVMVVLGGLGSLFGPLIGAVTFLLLEEGLSRVTEYPDLILGPVLLLVAIYLHGGIDGLLARAAPWLSPLLQIDRPDQALRRRGRRRRHHARHSAGRISCRHRPERRRQDDADRPASPARSRRRQDAIRFDGSDITRLPVYRRSRLGLARSFQITSLFPDFTALDNVALAVQAHRGHSFRFWRDARREDGIAQAGAGGARPRRPRRRAPGARSTSLSHGEHRQLEIAMALATDAAHAPARRADGRHGAGRIRPHGRDAAPAQGRHDHPVDRARHGRGVRAWPIASPCWSMAASSPRATRRRSGPMPPCAKPISAKSDE